MWQAEIFGHVRVIFLLLFFATLWVFYSNRQGEVEKFTSAELHLVIKGSSLPERLRAKALEHEGEVDQINR